MARLFGLLRLHRHYLFPWIKTLAWFVGLGEVGLVDVAATDPPDLSILRGLIPNPLWNQCLRKGNCQPLFLFVGFANDQVLGGKENETSR